MSADDEIARLLAENEALRRENAVLRGESGEGVTLDGLAATMRDFIARTDHSLHHHSVDEISDEVKALKEAEETMTPDEIAQARDMFSRYDTDGSGAIDTDELAMLMLTLGETVPQERLNQMIAEVDENNNGVIDFPEFLQLLAILSGEAEETDSVKKVKLGAVSYYGRSALIRWIKYDNDQINGDVTGPLVHPVRRLARGVALDKRLETFFYLAIVVAGTVSGLQTYDEFSNSAALVMIEWCTLLIFSVEMLLKFLAESAGKMHFFLADMWNVFDTVVLFALLVLTPIGEGEVAAVRILRIARAVRVLRAAKMAPKLTLVLETLIHSAGSVAYIAIFLILVMYIFAIAGVSMFHQNDPWHFGNLGAGMLALWRIATLEDWTDIMYFNQYGCEKWGDYAGATGGSECEHEAFGWIAVCYFSSFVLLSSFLMLNLFIGVITNAMHEAAEGLHKEKKDAARLAIATRLRAKAEAKNGGASASAVALKHRNPIAEEIDDADDDSE